MTKAPAVASVASFFISRVDNAIDPLLEHREHGRALAVRDAVERREDVATTADRLVHLARAAVLRLDGPVAPGAVERHAGLPHALLCHNVLLGSAEVAEKLVAVVDDDVWLE